MFAFLIYYEILGWISISVICYLLCSFYMQIKRLEMEMSSSQQNLDSVVELAKEQNICAMEKFGEVIELFCKLVN